MIKTINLNLQKIQELIRIQIIILTTLKMIQNPKIKNLKKNLNMVLNHNQEMNLMILSKTHNRLRKSYHILMNLNHRLLIKKRKKL